MINKQTIISAYDEKLTLVQWLKLVNKALDEAVLTNVEIAQRGNATFVFVFTFEDGTQVESNEIIVNQGESIVGASIENGHLLLTLSNDDVLDAGNVKPVSSFSFNSARHLIVAYGDGTTQDLGLIKGVSGFSINESQHLIVTYDNGTTEDLGAIFDGNVNIDGNFTANSIIENMSGYSMLLNSVENLTIENVYSSVVKTGNKLTIVSALNITKTDTLPSESVDILSIIMPAGIVAKLNSTTIGGYSALAYNLQKAIATGASYDVTNIIVKQSYDELRLRLLASTINNLPLNTKVYYRVEVTFLLSDDLVGL